MSDLDPFRSDEWQTVKTEDLEVKRSKKPLAILGVAALAAVLLMSFNVFKKSIVYYKYPSAVLASPGFSGRVQGTVVPGSISYDDANGVTTFTILDPTDKTTTIDVRYNGTAPDTLKDNAQAVAEGTYKDGVFQATQVLAKCPSKFGAQTPTPGV